MIFDLNEVVFSRYGVQKPSDLDPNRVMVYRSPSRFNPKLNSGEATTIISKSTSIPSVFHSSLERMNAKVSLGKTGKAFKNLHVYLIASNTLSGVFRICYIYPAGEDVLRVSEYAKRSQGSRYSSLFGILKLKMKAEGFPSNSESFKVTLDRVMEFVEIINQINLEFEGGKYGLVLGRGYDELVTGCFHRVYYIPKDIVDSQAGEETSIIDIMPEKPDTSGEQAKITLETVINL